MSLARPADTNFSMVVDTSFDPVVVLPVGDLDMSAAQPFRAALAKLIEAGHADIDLDLSGLHFMDSTGLDVLVRVQDSMTGTLTLVDPPDLVRRMLDVCQLSDRFPVR